MTLVGEGAAAPGPRTSDLNVLVLNVGSATLKFQLIRTDPERMAHDRDERLARGAVERIGGEALLTLGAAGRPMRRLAAPLRDEREAIGWILRWLTDPDSGVGLDAIGSIHAVGHRVVHGGEAFRRSVLIDDDVLRKIEEAIDFAPLHNPYNLRGIHIMREVLGPGVPQAAVFDTAFHLTLPEAAYLYAIPYWLYRRHRIRRYGFHGTSHRYVAYRYRRLTGTPREACRLITLHLGNGCSACAISGGDSVDTSMGFTPLEGLVMGTRSGDVDPAVLEVIAYKEGMSLGEVQTLLNKQSGLLGISGLTNDMRELLEEAVEHADRRARLAIEMFCYRARKYIGAYLAAMGGADAVIFTGGIGENAPQIRARICEGLQWFGLELDPELNAGAVGGAERRISSEGSRLAAWVIPTDEELLIARDTARLVLGLEPRY
ncbi:MAG TPA: acetate kinase [Longimicrobiales bacterium]|nr:acetate kinase [Longimicrobiales bacterium]